MGERRVWRLVSAAHRIVSGRCVQLKLILSRRKARRVGGIGVMSEVASAKNRRFSLRPSLTAFVERAVHVFRWKRTSRNRIGIGICRPVHGRWHVAVPTLATVVHS